MAIEAVNVEAQSRSLSSLLSATKRLIAVRKSTLAFGRGTMTFIRPVNRSVLAYVRQYRRRSDPLRRQFVALGASHRTRSFALEGTRPAGNARPHRFPDDRRTALYDHAGALRLLLVPAPAARKSEPAAIGRCPNSRRWWCRWRDLGIAGADPRRIRTRRAAGSSGAHPLVSGQGAARSVRR